MDKVSFIKMEDGTREEYHFLEELEREYIKGLPDRIIDALQKLETSMSGYQVSRLEHSLQGATRAERAGKSKEMIMSVLLHDIGDELAPHSHGELAAAVLRPFVSDRTYWVIKHHGLFQMYYYAHLTGGNRNVRDQFKDHPYYQDAVDFCHEYDQNCFDPSYDSYSLDHFIPMIREFFSREPTFDPEYQARFGEK